MAEEQAKLIDERLATKDDILAVRADIEALRLETKQDIEILRREIAVSAATAKVEILRWLFGTIGLQTFVLLGALFGFVRAAHN